MLRARRLTAATVLLALTACSPSTPAPDEPEDSTSAVTTTAEPTDDLGEDGPTEAERTQIPSTAPEGDSFGFDEAARFPDGLQFEVNAAQKKVLGDEAEGAEGTDGQVVVITLMVSNGTGESFNARPVTVRGYYGDGVGAPMVLDGDGTLVTGFGEEVPDGEDLQATFGFAVPAAEAKQITLVVDCNDDHLHPPIQFQGSAA